MKEFLERECEWCGATFVPTHGNNRTCPKCREVRKNRNLKIPTLRYAKTIDVRAYEKFLRERNVARFKDHIVAEGYASRQIAKTLEMVGKVEV